MSEPDSGILQHGQDFMTIPFVQVPLSAACDTSLSDGAYRLYSIILGYMRPDQPVAWPGQERLAEQMGVTTRTVRTYLRDIESHDLLTIEHRKGFSSVYRLFVPEPRKPASALPRKPASALPRKPASAEVHQGEVHQGEVRAPLPAEDLRLIGEVADKPSTRCGLRLQSKLRRFSGRDLKLVCTYLEIAASDPRGNAASDQGKCSRVDVLVELLTTHGHAAWIHGLEECRRLGKAGDAYITAIIQGYDPVAEKRSRPSAGSAISDDGPTIIDRKLAQEEAERAEALRREREGQA